MHGAFLKKTLEKEKIGVLNLIEDEHYFTTLAFVAIDENGEREFSFSRKPGADTKLQADELNLELLQNCKIFHFGSLSLTAQPAHEATVTARNKILCRIRKCYGGTLCAETRWYPSYSEKRRSKSNDSALK